MKEKHQKNMHKRAEMKKSYKKIRFKNLQREISMFFLVLLIPTCIIFIYTSVRFVYNTALQNSINYMGQVTKQINYNIDTYIKSIEDIEYMFKYNSDVKKYLLLDAEDEEKQRAEKRIREQMETILEVRGDICNIGIVGSNGRILLNQDEINPYANITDKLWYKKTLERHGMFTISGSHVQNIVKDKYEWVITLSSALMQEVEEIGVLFADLNYQVIKDVCSQIDLHNDSYVFLIDDAGKIVYHPEQRLIYSGLKGEFINKAFITDEPYFIIEKEGEEYLYTIAQSEVTGWKAVGVVNIRDLLYYETQEKNIYFITSGVIVLAAIFLSFKLARRVTQPICTLESAMRKSELGDFKAAQLEIVEENEIGRLGKTFNVMNKKIAQLIDEKVLAEQLKRKSELRALQAQINPHFLYNTLDSIIWMAEGGKNQEVVKMTAQLAKLLRQSISNDHEIVKIGKEISYAQGYLEIQKMRYKDQLNYEIQVSMEINNYYIVKLVIQPLIENAIYHGIKYKGSPGNIVIKGYMEEERIVIEINDNGIGMDENTLKNIFCKKESSSKSNGVGIYNVYSRLKMHYGEECEMTYQSQVGQGTRVKIAIPKKEEEE